MHRFKKLFCKCILDYEGIIQNLLLWAIHRGCVVLVVTPPLKKLCIRTGSRLFEIPNRSDIYITNPKMRNYLNVSTRISHILMKYVTSHIVINCLHQLLMNSQTLNKTAYIIKL